MKPSIRAAWITLALVVHGLAAAPLPTRIRAHEMQSPDSIQESQRWADVLNFFGLGVTAEGLLEFSRASGEIATETRQTLLKPFQPLLRLTGTGQGWGLFTHPDRFPDHLEVYGRSGDDWRLLYQAFDPEHDFLAEPIAYRRIRGIWDGSANKPKPSYNNFVDWVAREAFVEFSDLEEIRVQFRRHRTATPHEQKPKLNKVRHRRTRSREDLR